MRKPKDIYPMWIYKRSSLDFLLAQGRSTELLMTLYSSWLVQARVAALTHSDITRLQKAQCVSAKHLLFGFFACSRTKDKTRRKNKTNRRDTRIAFTELKQKMGKKS
jgi:hypothetical protein